MSKQQNIENPLHLGIIHPKSAGIDVGSMSMFVSYINTEGKPIVKEFGAYTEDLESLSAELKLNGITDVGMEATGVYWMALYDLLAQAGIVVTLANARHYKNVAGQKTDVKDCQWLHQLHAHGLLRSSHIATDQYRELRMYIHERTLLLKHKADTLNRIQKVLSQMNVKVQHIISDMEGVIGMQILERIASGCSDPESILSGMKLNRLKATKEELVKSLKGNYKPHYLAILRNHLAGHNFYKQQMLVFEKYIEVLLAKLLPAQEPSAPIKKKTTKSRKGQYHFNVREYLHRLVGVDLTEIDGLDENTILTILSVVGLDMNKWPTADHFASWLNLAAKPSISGGKVIGSKKSFTNNVATQAFRMGAQTMWQQKGTLGHLYRRLSHTKGTKKAIKAVARRLAIIFYTMIKKQTAYDQKQVVLNEERIRARKLARLQKEAEQLGCRVEILTA